MTIEVLRNGDGGLAVVWYGADRRKRVSWETSDNDTDEEIIEVLRDILLTIDPDGSVVHAQAAQFAHLENRSAVRLIDQESAREEARLRNGGAAQRLGVGSMELPMDDKMPALGSDW